MANEKVVPQSVFEESIKDLLTELVNSTFDWQEYSDSEISDILEITDDQAMELTKIINDQIVANNKLWSSSKTDSEIQNVLIDANKYADELIGQISSISLEYVTTLPTSDIKSNVIYILQGNPNTLNVYNTSTSAFVSVGDLNLDLTGYYTSTQVDNLLADKADDNTVVHADDVVQDLTTTSGTTVLSSAGLQTELDKKANNDEVVKTTDIVTTIDSTSTDSQVPSAKAVYDKYSLHNLSEANTIVVDDALLVDPHNQNGVNNKDCLVTSSSTQKPDDLLWGIRQVFWHADSDLVLKITGKDINNKGCIWINSLMPKDGKYSWQGWSKNVTSSSSEGANKLLTIKQANACTFSGETITSNSGDTGGGCVFTAPVGVKTVAFDLISDGIFCQCGLCDMSGTLPTIITVGNNRGEFKNITTLGTYYIENIKAGSNIYIGGDKGMQISNIRVTEWY